MMKKLFRRLAYVFLVLGIVLIAAGLYVRSKVREVPAWYRHLDLDDATQHQASLSMLQKLAETYGTANDAVAAATRAQFPDPTSKPVQLPPTPMTLELSEAEINSFFAEWDEKEHWRQRISKFVVDPVVILEDHELILAGTVTEWNVVVSVHFEPRIENGKLNLNLTRVMAGTLELPKSTIASYVAKIDALVDPEIARHRPDAQIGPKGWANVDAVSVAMGELLKHTVHEEPAEPVLMLREVIKQGSDARSMPVQVTGVNISDKALKVNMRTMTPDEREALELHLRGGDVTASSSAGN